MGDPAAYREEKDRRQDMLAAIARAKLSLHQVQSELHTSGGTKDEIRRINLALDQLGQLENTWSW
jgi:hypothetical protein